MKTIVLSVDARAPASDAIARAADVLRRGGLVGFPTETVYGLGANALDAGAVAGIFAAKGRPANNPLIVHVADVGTARTLVADWPQSAEQLAQRFWPGPLTLVLLKNDLVPAIVTANGPTLALRVPAHPVALALLRATGLPLAAPSANRSSRLSPTRATHVLRDLDGSIDLVLDAGPTAGGVESTVLDLTATPARLLRPGLVSPADIEAVIGPIERGARAEQAKTLPSPGLLAKHYAPTTALECVPNDADRVRELLATGERVGWMTFAGPESSADARLVREIMPTDPSAYAARLYETLHRLDTQGLDHIVVTPPPGGDEWLAIRDRLRRAAGEG